MPREHGVVDLIPQGYHAGTMLQHLGLIFFDVWLFWFLDDGRLHREGRDKKHEQGFLRCFCEGVIVVLFVGCCFWGGVLVVMFCVDVSLLLSYVVVVVVAVVMVVWLCLFGVISDCYCCCCGCVLWTLDRTCSQFISRFHLEVWRV